MALPATVPLGVSERIAEAVGDIYVGRDCPVRVVGLSDLVFGLGVSGLSTPLAIGDVAISGLALAAVIGVVANLILPLTEEDEEVALPADEMVS